MTKNLVHSLIHKFYVKFQSFNEEQMSLTLFLSLALYFHFKRIFGPDPFIQMGDSFDSVFPRLQTVAAAISKFGPFQWYPYESAGIPAHAWLAAPENIYTFFHFFLSMNGVNTLFLFFYMLGAQVGMYRLLKKWFKLDFKIALLFAAVFGLGSQIQAISNIWTTFNFLFPLFLSSFLELNLSKLTIKGFIWRLVVVNLMFLAAPPVLTISFYAPMTLLMVVFYHKYIEKLPKRVFRNTFLIWTAYLLFSGISIYALYDFFPYVNRVYPTKDVEFLQIVTKTFKNISHQYFALSGKAMLFWMLLPALFYVRRSQKLKFFFILSAVLIFVAALMESDFVYLYHHSIVSRLIFSFIQFSKR